MRRGGAVVVPARPDEAEEPAARAGWRATPRLLAYLIGPAALVLVLTCRHFGLIAREPVWAWLVVFAVVPLVGGLVDVWYRRRPSEPLLRLRVAAHVAAAAAATVIYLTGWGSILVVAFVVVAVENVSLDGSRTWSVTALSSVAAVAVGQVLVSEGIAPSLLTDRQSQALAVMETFVVLFVIRMFGAMVEQTERAEAAVAANEERFRSLVQHSSDTTVVLDPTSVVTYASPSVAGLLGMTPDEVVGRPSSDFLLPEDLDSVGSALDRRGVGSEATDTLHFRMARPDGSTRWVEAVVADLRDNPAVGGYVANLRDVTERREAEDRLAHQALHDPLTGLPNRALILDRADRLLATARREGGTVAALFVDLDNFKAINDSLGHEAGDLLLRAVALRFAEVLRDKDTVGRLGGDEFVVLAGGLDDGHEPLALAERLHAVLREPVVVDAASAPLTVTASVGVAVGTRPGAAELLRDADTALYRAKALGKDRTVLFEPRMHAEAAELLRLETDLASAALGEDLFLGYRPVVAVDPQETCGVEALLRWRRPGGEVLPPARFVPALESSGRIVEVGRWALDRACHQASALQAKGYASSMSVNVSARQLASPTLADDVRRALAGSGLPPELLMLEVAEATLARADPEHVRNLAAAKALGVRVAVDDFGTGYSSLATLHRIAVDALKLDHAMLAALGGPEEGRAVVRAVIDLGRALGLEVLAEGAGPAVPAPRHASGAETARRLQLGADGEPMDAEDVEELLTGASGRPVQPRLLDVAG